MSEAEEAKLQERKWLFEVLAGPLSITFEALNHRRDIDMQRPRAAASCSIGLCQAQSAL